MTDEKYARRVGYIGLGNMGAGIATRLARVGLQVAVFDLQEEVVEKLVAEGAMGAASLEELAASSDTIIVCVDPEKAVVDVVHKLIPHLNPAHTVIVQSSIPPAMLLESARLVEATGAKLYDAPVSGSMKDRLDGTLAVLVGASEESVGSDRALLEAIGRPLYLDTLGGGEMAKLVNNAIMTVTRHAVSEGMALAAAYGLSEDNVRKAAAISSGASWVLDNWEYFNEQLSNGFILRQKGKQAREIIAMAEEKGVRMRMLGAVRDHGLNIDRERYRLITGQNPDSAV